MVWYSVKQISKLADVSIRTLHYYDQIGLLKPSIRSEAGYRFYGESEIIRLQQILFYRELDFPLQKIRDILDDPEFDLVKALSGHKEALKARQNRIVTLITTIDKTIDQIKNGGKMLKPEELYGGLSKDKAEMYRKDAVEKYGEKAVITSENYLRKLSKEELNKLKSEQQEITKKLASLIKEDYKSDKVQNEITRHYEITRKFWGTFGSGDPQAEAYAGLGRLYEDDERFTMTDGKPNPELALFLKNAIAYFAGHSLK
jgi:DNA-binding transcriptional MerR regulator